MWTVINKWRKSGTTAMSTRTGRPSERAERKRRKKSGQWGRQEVNSSIKWVAALTGCSGFGCSTVHFCSLSTWDNVLLSSSSHSEACWWWWWHHAFGLLFFSRNWGCSEGGGNRSYNHVQKPRSFIFQPNFDQKHTFKPTYDWLHWKIWRFRNDPARFQTWIDPCPGDGFTI